MLISILLVIYLVLGVFAAREMFQYKLGTAKRKHCYKPYPHVYPNRIEYTPTPEYTSARAWSLWTLVGYPVTWPLQWIGSETKLEKSSAY
jgi:hypothetical protein